MTSAFIRSLSRWGAPRLFFLLYPVLVTALLTFGYPIYQQYENNIKDTLLAQEQAHINSSILMFKKEMFERIGDLNLVSGLPILKDYLNTRDANKRQALATYFQQLAETYRRYDQVRLLDIDGREVVRINIVDGQAVQVPANELQDKSDRYYIKEAMQLDAGQLYVSRMDLNVENGRIEQPYKPVIRFAKPVFDGQGENAGLVVMNYMAGGLLEAFRDAMARRHGHHGMLIDSDGYWLSNHDRANEWGADLARPEKRFASLYPDAWPIIANQPEGQLETPLGLFLFREVNPLEFAEIPMPHMQLRQTMGISHISGANNDWKVVIFLPRAQIQAASFLYSPINQLLIGLFFLLLAAVLFLLIQRNVQQRLQRERDHKVQAELVDLYEHAPCGYHSLDDEGRLTRINQTELDWLGYDRAELIGKPFHQLLTEPSVARFRDYFEQFKACGQLDDIDVEVRRRNGDSFHVSISAKAIRNQQGMLITARASSFDISDRVKMAQQLESQARTDLLTGISNRRFFYEQGETELERARRHQSPMALMLLDADHFKRVNDQHGHDAGDAVLKAMAETAKQSLRTSDLLARFGGEEFIVLMPETTLTMAQEAAERLRSLLGRATVSIPSGETLSISVSIGVSMLEPGDKDLDALIKRADNALYQAKAAGRDCVRTVNGGGNMVQQAS
ncbi:sensor domain-containing diguanylate cyclase [Marinobacterium arenosum]|uniref:sensor domain-containing diguanylate cyclase n=1 Tax=Marinobacterium arenosum TaxID=2862496 RepID=UPI001C97B30A|nr:diguanylate cyclase [Marinobacterium arenosum]MBY4677718.1 diguanylate cyclase [Marinobacterium arenosum]